VPGRVGRARRCGGCRAMVARGAIAARGAGSWRVVFRRARRAGRVGRDRSAASARPRAGDVAGAAGASRRARSGARVRAGRRYVPRAADESSSDAIAARGAGSRRVVFRRDSGSRRGVEASRLPTDRDRCRGSDRVRAGERVVPGAWAAAGAQRVRGRGRATWPAPRVRRGGVGPGPACGRAGGTCRVPPTNHPRAGGRDQNLPNLTRSLSVVR